MSASFPAALAEPIRAIEREIYSRPESVIRPLRELLQKCEGDDQRCYVYQQLGFAFLRLFEHRMSRIFYEQALALQPDNIYVLANLAHAVTELGDKSKGVEYGQRALRLKDELAMAGGPSPMGVPHGGSKKLISFSLYGAKAKYCETAVLNCVAAKEHLPGFVCRFYVDQSVPADVTRRLRDHSAEIVVVEGRVAGFFGMFWRFLALDDEDADIVLVRDADSLVDAREAYCVNEWIRSGKPFHIIRDDCCHTELIQGGLFAARSGVVNDVEERIARFSATAENQPIRIFSDQLFLRTSVWPMVRDHALTHDSVYRYGADVRDIPADIPGARGVRNHFIGAGYANSRLHFSTQDPFEENARFFLRIVEEGGAIVCEYEMDRASGQQLEIILPPSHVQRIEAGAWRCEIYSKAA